MYGAATLKSLSDKIRKYSPQVKAETKALNQNCILVIDEAKPLILQVVDMLQGVQYLDIKYKNGHWDWRNPNLYYTDDIALEDIATTEYSWKLDYKTTRSPHHAALFIDAVNDGLLEKIIKQLNGLNKKYKGVLTKHH